MPSIKGNKHVTDDADRPMTQVLRPHPSAAHDLDDAVVGIDPLDQLVAW